MTAYCYNIYMYGCAIHRLERTRHLDKLPWCRKNVIDSSVKDDLILYSLAFIIHAEMALSTSKQSFKASSMSVHWTEVLSSIQISQLSH